MATLEKAQQNSSERERFFWHWQRLGREDKSILNARCWWHFPRQRTIGLEWNLFSPSCAISVDIDDEDVTFGISIPFLVSIWLSFSTQWAWVTRLAPRVALQYYPDTIVIDHRELSVRVHSGTVWLKLWGPRDDWKRDDPWWKRGVNFSINPFEWKFMRHEVRRADGMWVPCGDGRKLGESDVPDGREVLVYPYWYQLKSGEVQKRTATIFVERRAWRPRVLRWMGLIEKVWTCIDVRFSEEVGERTGSWKGGCTGCSYELKRGETPEQSLRRMERDRKF